jgi:hypothetical protein
MNVTGMNPGTSQASYQTLVALTDRILEDCEDDVECIAVRLAGLEPEVRNELLVSDLLNAWQVFWYCFRTDPGIDLREMMELEPASVLATGLKLGEIDLLELHFALREQEPVIAVFDGEKTVASFSGRNAYRDAVAHCTNPVVR